MAYCKCPLPGTSRGCLSQKVCRASSAPLLEKYAFDLPTHRGTWRSDAPWATTLFGGQGRARRDVAHGVEPKNEQHSALVLRLMRNRANDSMLAGEGDTDEALRACSTMHAPQVATPDSSVQAELPLYHARRKLVARDARAVVAAYLYEVKFKLPVLMGLRCCPFCPRCNVADSPRPCQDVFGANTLPMGGIAGLACSMSGAAGYQKRALLISTLCSTW